MIYEYNVSYYDLGQVNHKETKTETNKQTKGSVPYLSQSYEWQFPL